MNDTKLIFPQQENEMSYQPIKHVSLSGSKTIYLEAIALDDNAVGPEWARVELTQWLIDKLLSKVNQCRDNDDARVYLNRCPDEWDDSREEQDVVDFGSSELAISADGDFWFEAYSKYGGYLVETRACSIAALLSHLGGTSVPGSADIIERGGILIYHGSGGENLLERLQELEVLSQN